MGEINTGLEVTYLSVIFITLLVTHLLSWVLRKIQEWEKRNDKDEH